MWGTADEREALQRSVAQPVRARRLRDALTGVATAAVVAFAKGGDAMVTLIAGLLGAVVGFAFGPGVGRRVLVPRDVAAMPSWPSVGIGRIVGAREIVAPGTTTRCAAWLIELRYEGDWGSRTTLRAGATAGFDVELDSGERVRVPAGAVWLAGRLAQFDGYNAVATATPLIRFIDPHGAQSPWPLFSFNIIAEQVVYAGDRVEVLGEVEPRPIAADPVPASGTAAPGGDHVFRDAPPTMLFHRSLPVLGVVADKGKD